MPSAYKNRKYKKKPKIRGLMIQNIGRKIDKQNQIRENSEIKKLFKALGLVKGD